MDDSLWCIFETARIIVQEEARIYIPHLTLLTINVPNFLNGIIHFPFLTLSIIIFRDIKMKT